MSCVALIALPTGSWGRFLGTVGVLLLLMKPWKPNPSRVRGHPLALPGTWDLFLWNWVHSGFQGAPRAWGIWWVTLSPFCPQITAVCNFFTYIRYIQQGLVRQDGECPLVDFSRNSAQGRETGQNWGWLSTFQVYFSAAAEAEG